MINFLRHYSGQSLSRVLALAVPFGLTLAARALFPNDQSAAFFQILPDAVLLTAIVKLGVDIYVARSRTENGRVLVSYGYMIVFNLVSTLCMIFFLASPPNSSSLVQALGIASLVTQTALLAEIARTRGWFSLFYLLKAPIIYIAVTIWVFSLLTYPVLTKGVAVVLLVIMITVNYRFTLFDESGENWSKIFPATILSILIVLFSWKEAILLNQFSNIYALEIAVFYTRFKILITFFFTLHNARIPNLMRKAKSKAIERSQLHDIARGPRTLIWSWGIFSLLVGFFVVWTFDPTAFLPASIILMSSIILIFFGNLVPILNAIDQQKPLIFAFAQALITFFLLSSLIASFTNVLTAVSIAAFIAQIALGLHLLVVFRHVFRLSLKQT